MAENRILHPKILPLPLDLARDNAPFDIEGDFIGVFDATDAVASVDVRIQDPGENAFTFKRGRSATFGVHYTRLYITNAVQAGKILFLMVGGPETFKFEDVGAISVNSITDPIFVNCLKAPQTKNSQVSVGAASTLLRTVPANTIELIRVCNRGLADMFIAFGVAAVASTSKLATDDVEFYFVSGGAGGLSINAISPSGAQNCEVLAVPIK